MLMYARLAPILGLEFSATLGDKRRPSSLREDADIVHAAMAEVELSLIARHGYEQHVDVPWQHYQFAGRADVVVWDPERSALLHVENKTQLPDVQDAIGRFNGTRTYLWRSMRDDLAGPLRPRSETHVFVALWSSEVLRVVRRHAATFRATWPDPPELVDAWLRGDPPSSGRAAAFVLMDPFATGRQRRWVGLEAALGEVRPRVAGYAAAATRLRTGRP
jgi:hypothetical protein